MVKDGSPVKEATLCKSDFVSETQAVSLEGQ